MKTTKTVLSIGLAVVLALSVFAMPNLGMKTANAAVSALSLKTSADDHGKKFFGDSLLQVFIEDPAADDTDDTADVNIEVRSNTGSLVVTSTETIPDTSDGSQRFEFFLKNVSSPITPKDPDATVATVLTIGNGGDLDTAPGNFGERFTVKIIYKSLSTTITLDDTSSTIKADRDNYGSDNLVFLSIMDQDGNADPTNRDVIVTQPSGADQFITMSGISSVSNSTCVETGTNSAEFECEWTISTVAGAGKLVPTDLSDNSISITATDVSRYMSDSAAPAGQITAADNNVVDSNKQSGQAFESITVDDADGDLGTIPAVSTSSELKFTLTDTDRDLSSKSEDDITDPDGINTFEPGVDSINDLADPANGVEGVIVYIDIAGGDSEEVPMTETADSSGAFIPDLSNDELPVTFLAAGETPTRNNGVLEFNQTGINEDIVVAYVDPAADGGPLELASTVTKELDTTAGSVDVTGTVGINADFTLTVTDSDWNDNPRTKDSYKLILRGDGDANAGAATTEFQISRGSSSISDDSSDALYATMEVELKGDAAVFTTPGLNYTLTETGDSTGVFTANLDMGDILADLQDETPALTVDDGDNLKFTLHDYMEDTEHESQAQVTIGRASSNVDFSRDDVPVPPEPGGVTDDAINSNVVLVTLSITDPDRNTQTGSEDTITLDLSSGNAEVKVDSGSFDVDTVSDGVNPALTGSVNLQDIVVETLNGLDLQETGPNTGVFEEDLHFRLGTGPGDELTFDDYQDMRFTLVYINDQGDRDSSGITFRGHDGVVDSDKAAVSTGSILTVTVQDDDLNLDSTEIEEFNAIYDDSASLLGIKVQDDDIDQGTGTPTGERFTETGEDTGIFTATFEIGTDLEVVDLANSDQASNIHITYNDEIDSSGGTGEEIELDVPVVSATGAMQIKPDLVGPGTKLTVLIIDADLNEKSSGKDTIDADTDVLELRTDRNEVGKTGVDLEETGPDTGVFQFTIQLVTDQSDCKDDNLSLPKYDATHSGDEASIGACPGDLVAIKYTDEHNANGDKKSVSKVVEVKSWDPEFVADKTAYNVGDKATISISDPDANRDPDVADTLRDIRVSSETDQVGEELSAIETGKDTGVFKLSFGLTGSATSGGVEVTKGDTVTVRYTDDFPADFTASEEDKDFKYTFTVGVGAPTTGAITPTAPALTDATGKVLTSVIVGQQVVLTTTIVNNQDAPQTHATILEVRDGNGVTVFIGWGTGTLAAKASTNIGLSWTPDNPGSYTLRTFVLDDLATPQILSNTIESKITVS